MTTNCRRVSRPGKRRVYSWSHDGSLHRTSMPTGIRNPIRRKKKMITRSQHLLTPRRRWPMIIALLLTAACSQSGGRPQTPPAGGWHEFEGTWTAAGTRRTLRLGPDDRAAIFELTGSVLLTGAQRPSVGFRAQAIGFSDSRAGMQGRCVWTDERGEMVYSELKGEAVGSGNRLVGRFVGGAGRA